MSLGQVPHTFVIQRTSVIILNIVLINAFLWLDLFVMLPRYIYPTPAYVIAGACVVKDVFKSYLRINQSRFIVSSGSYSDALVLQRMVRYQALIFITKYCGPTRAMMLVWLIPLVTNVIQGIFWLWRWPAMEEYMNRVLFQRYYKPHIAYIQGPFPQRSIKSCQSAGLHHFDVKSRSWHHAIIWDLLIEAVRYVSHDVTLFSGDSWPSKAVALALAYFLRSRYCPRPAAVKHARSVCELFLRAYNDTIHPSTNQCPSFRQCLDQQRSILRHLYQRTISSVERLEGRPIHSELLGDSSI